MNLYSRWISFFGLLICLFLLGFAAYLQVSLGLAPCPLCVLQRALILLLAFIFFIGSLYTPLHPGGKRFQSASIVIVSLVGVLVAAHHVSLQHQPPGTVVSCSPTLDYILKNLPLDKAWGLIFNGSGDCAVNQWSLFGFSIPQWTLAFFAFFAVAGLVRYLAVKKKD